MHSFSLKNEETLIHKQDSNIKINRTVRGCAYEPFCSGYGPLVGSCERGVFGVHKDDQLLG